jgi:thiamine thiazole synthase
MAARELAQHNLNTLVVERNNYLGGGFWIGGYFMNKLVFRAPCNEILDELKIRYLKDDNGLFVTDGAEACSKLIASASDAGVKFLQLTDFDDIILREENDVKKINGVVINWSPVKAIPRQISCVDPVALESKYVIDASGHSAIVVKSLEKRGLYETKGYGPMWVDRSEEQVLEYTKEIFPGLVVCGMSVSETFGIPRMGPVFSAMLFSGKKAAQIILKKFGIL